MLNVNAYSFNNFKNQLKPAFKTTSNPQKLNIFYYNDTHGNTDQMSGIVENAKLFKAQNKDSVNFVLSAGDNCSGADIKKNAFVFNLMQNMMGVDISAIGNHEMDGGSEGFFEAMNNKHLTFVATNIETDKDNPINNFIRKSVIKEQNGVKTGFVGAMPVDFKDCTKEEAQKGIEVMDFDDTVEAIQEEIDNLKKQGINKIILVSHMGYETDKKLVSQLDGIDIVIGGHSHSVVEGAKDGENVLKSKSNEPVIITQAGENGKYYGLLNIEFDENGIIKSYDNKLIKSSSRSKNPSIEYIKGQEVGISPKVATAKVIDKMPENRRISPCAWTNYVADSMKQELDGDIALINSANIRKVPAVGAITQMDITESAPMKNQLIKTKLTQKQLVEAIKNASKRTMSSSEGTPGLLQVSGLTYKIDDSGNLLEMNFIDKKGNTTLIDINNPSDSITYTAIYDSFTSKAGGEYPELEPKFEIEKFDFDKDKTMMDYLSKLPNKDSLEITDDHRIEIQKTSQPKPKGNNSQNFLDLTVPKVS